MNVIPMNLVDIQGSKKTSPKNGKKLESKEIGKKRNLQETCNSGSSTPGKNTILQFLKESTNKRRKLDGNEISTQNSIKTQDTDPKFSPLSIENSSEANKQVILQQDSQPSIK